MAVANYCEVQIVVFLAVEEEEVTQEARLGSHGNLVAAGTVLRLGRGLIVVRKDHIDVTLLLEVDTECVKHRLVESLQILRHFQSNL